MSKCAKILVSGGAGFLGTHLCKRLLMEGHEVIGVDNFCTGRKENFLHLLAYEGFTVLHHDIIQPLRVAVDLIFNLACAASPIHYQSNPVHTTMTCLQGAWNMLELARECNAKIFQSSTSEVYGDPEVHPQREDYWGCVNPVGPRACYDEGKRCAETLFFDYHRHYQVSIKVGRIFNTYGPYMQPNDGRVISNFIVQALQNQPITIYGDGTQTRSFCYVDDLIEVMLRFMNSESDFIGPVNMGNPEEFSVLQLAEKIIQLTGSRSLLIQKPLPTDDPVRRCPDIGLAREKLNWQPSVPLEEGLQKTINYFDKVLTRKGHVLYQKRFSQAISPNASQSI